MVTNRPTDIDSEWDNSRNFTTQWEAIDDFIASLHPEYSEESTTDDRPISFDVTDPEHLESIRVGEDPY